MNVRDMFDLTGKTAVVTGGSIGLGAQMAKGLAEAGANVVIAARKVERCIELCKQLENLGVQALPVACDAAKEDDCRQLVDKAFLRFGSLDILINNAGITWGADSLDYPIARWQQVLNVNLTAVFHLSVMAAKIMKEQGGGKIINITSLSGYGGTLPEDMDAVAYNASKGAVITLTKDLAVKWARYGIYVNSIAPGFFPTHMSGYLIEQNETRYLSQIPMGRFGGDDDLKGAVVFLSSAVSNYITGQIINVDGGQMALV
jgi:gluconate 5-dehydrogenase